MVKKKLNIIGDYLTKRIAKEWQAQGHNLTGKFVRELKYEVKSVVNGYLIEGRMPDYGKYIEKGTKSSSIPYSPISGARSSKYIDALVEFVKARGMASSLKEATSIAFAIAKVQKKEGMPTIRSHKFSSTRTRIRFLSRSLEDSRRFIRQEINKIFKEMLQIEVKNIVRETNKKL